MQAGSLGSVRCLQHRPSSHTDRSSAAVVWCQRIGFFPGLSPFYGTEPISRLASTGCWSLTCGLRQRSVLGTVFPVYSADQKSRSVLRSIVFCHGRSPLRFAPTGFRLARLKHHSQCHALLLTLWQLSATFSSAVVHTDNTQLYFFHTDLHSKVQQLLVACIDKLENVAIVNALQLEAARATSVLLRRHTKFDVTEHIHCRIIAFLLLIHYFTL